MLRKQMETKIDSTSRDAYIVVGIWSEYNQWSKQVPFIYDLLSQGTRNIAHFT